MRLLVPPGVFSPPSDAYTLPHVLRQEAPGRDVLDVGTGSGVLAVSAALAKARSVTAVDVSRRALLTARMNAALNGVRVRARRGDMRAAARGERSDVIVPTPPYLPAENQSPPRGIDRATEA